MSAHQEEIKSYLICCGLSANYASLVTNNDNFNHYFAHFSKEIASEKVVKKSDKFPSAIAVTLKRVMMDFALIENISQADKYNHDSEIHFISVFDAFAQASTCILNAALATLNEKFDTSGSIAFPISSGEFLINENNLINELKGSLKTIRDIYKDETNIDFDEIESDWIELRMKTRKLGKPKKGLFGGNWRQTVLVDEYFYRA